MYYSAHSLLFICVVPIFSFGNVGGGTRCHCAVLGESKAGVVSLPLQVTLRRRQRG